MNVLRAHGQVGCPYPAVEGGVRAREGAEPTALPSFMALADPRAGPAVHLLPLSTCTPARVHVTACDPSSPVHLPFPPGLPGVARSVCSACTRSGVPLLMGRLCLWYCPLPRPSPCAGGSAGLCSLKESLTDRLCGSCAASQGLVTCGRRGGKGRRTRDVEERGGRGRQRGDMERQGSKGRGGGTGGLKNGQKERSRAQGSFLCSMSAGPQACSVLSSNRSSESLFRLIFPGFLNAKEKVIQFPYESEFLSIKWGGGC